MNPKYYQLCTLTYSVGDKHDICKALMQAGVLTEYRDPKEAHKPIGESDGDQPLPEEQKND